MKRTEVVMHYAPWMGSEQVSPEDAGVLVTYGWEINGHDISDSCVRLVVDTFISVEIAVAPPYSDPPDEMDEKNRIFHEEQIAAIRDELTEEDWLEGTTDDLLILPVASIEMVERPLAAWLAE